MPQDDSDQAWLKQASCQQRHCSRSDACQSADGPCGAVECVAHHINNLPPAILHGIFGHLGPRELCAVSAVCSHWRQLNQDKAANGVWKKFYTSRWRVLGSSGEDVCWQTKYGSKMKQGKSWSGKYEYDGLYGHKAGVKALKLLPSQGVLLTGSLDRTIRLWDLTFGMPLSISRPHGGTVRAVALDHTLVASGSSDNVVRLWHGRNSTNGSTLLDPAEASAAAAASGWDLGLADSLMDLEGPADSGDQASAVGRTGAGSSGSVGLTAAAVAAADAIARRRFGRGPYSVVTGEADEGLFDLSLPGQHLRGHIGPVTSLCLTDSCLYSGSWDYTVRVWRRGSWDCVSVLKYPDWVYSVVARGGQLLVASGPEVHVHDQATGKLVRKFQNLHEGSVSCLEGTHSGRLLFSGGADGLLMAHDLRMKEASRVLWHHNAGVNGLALEDPWLVSAASDGTVIMHNLEAALPNNFSGCIGPGSTSTAGSKGASSSNSNNSKRTLGCPGQPGPMYCVDMAESWLAAGGESPAVPTWDFTKAEEAAARAAAARAARGSSKRAAKLRKAAAASSAACAGSSSGAAAGAPAPVGGKSQACSKTGKSSRNAAGSSSFVAGAATSSACLVTSAAAVSGNSANAGRRLRPGLLAAAAAAASSAASTLSSTPPGSSSLASGSSRTDRFHKLQLRRGSNKSQQQQEGPGSSLDDPAAAGTVASTEQREASAAAGPGQAGSSSVLGGSSGHAANRTNRAQIYRSSSGGGGSGGHIGCDSSYGSSPQARWHGSQQYSSSSGSGSCHAGSCSSPVQHGMWLGGSSPPAGSSRLHHSSSSNGGGVGGRRHSNNGQGHVQQQSGGGSRLGIPIPVARHSQQRQKRLGPQVDSAGSCEQGWHAFGMSPTGTAGPDSGASPSYAAAVSARHAAGQRPSAGADAGTDCSCPADQGNACGEADSARAGAAAARYYVPFSSSYPSAAQGPGPWLVPGSSPRYEVWGTTLRIAAATNCDRRLAIKQPEGAARKIVDGGAAGANVVGGEEAPITLVSGSISN